MIEALLALGESARPLATAGLLVFLRVGTMMAVLPAFGERGVPMRVRLALTLAFTMILTPAVFPRLEDVATGGDIPLHFFATEAVSGLALGLGIRMFVFVLQTAGEIAAQSASLAQIFGGSNTAEALPAFGNLMLFAGLALAALAGLHIKVASAMILSYDLFPPGIFLPAPDLADWGIARVAATFALAFSLAAPFVIASLVYNLALGVINRAMPQLMVAFVGAPAISGGGLLILFFAMPTLLDIWLRAFDLFLGNPGMGRP